MSLVCIGILIQRNAAVNAAMNICGWTPLHKASALGNLRLVKVEYHLSVFEINQHQLLLAFGADPRLTKSDGIDALVSVLTQLRNTHGQGLARRNERIAVSNFLLDKEKLWVPLVYPTSLQLACIVHIRKALMRDDVGLDGKMIFLPLL